MIALYVLELGWMLKFGFEYESFCYGLDMHVIVNANIVVSESADKASIEVHYGWLQLNPALSMVEVRNSADCSLKRWYAGGKPFHWINDSR